MTKKALFSLKITLEDQNGPAKNYLVKEEMSFSDNIESNVSSSQALKKVTRRLRNILTNIAKYGQGNGE